MSERASVAESASEASTLKQANERTNEQTDERVAQYCSLYFLLFWPTVPLKLHVHSIALTDLVKTPTSAASSRSIGVANFFGRIPESFLERVVVEVSLHLT